LMTNLFQFSIPPLVSKGPTVLSSKAFITVKT
jgi:hypothetical protein